MSRSSLREWDGKQLSIGSEQWHLTRVAGQVSPHGNSAEEIHRTTFHRRPVDGNRRAQWQICQRDALRAVKSIEVKNDRRGVRITSADRECRVEECLPADAEPTLRMNDAGRETGGTRFAENRGQ